MFRYAYEFDHNLGWCVASVSIDNAFLGSACAATSCGVTQGDCDILACGSYVLGDAVDAYLDDADAAEATYGGPIGEWDVSCVTDMDEMFQNADLFNGAIDAWDVSSVTDMSEMFWEAKAFNGAIDAWDVSSVTDMFQMFTFAEEFNGAIGAWDVSSVMYMYKMFYYANEFNA